MIKQMLAICCWPHWKLIAFQGGIPRFSHVQLFATLRTAAHQSPLSMGFSRWEYCSGLPCPPPGNLPNPGIKPKPLTSPALAGGFFTTSNTWEAQGDSFPSHPLNESEQYFQMFYMLPPKTKDTYKILHLLLEVEGVRYSNLYFILERMSQNVPDDWPLAFENFTNIL